MENKENIVCEKIVGFLKKTLISSIVVAAAGALLSANVGFAQNLGKGSVTKLPIPRFVSLKSNPVNLRVGPGKEYPVEWTYLKSGVPLEVTQEFEHWRRVRDSEGAEGWVFHSLLSSQRNAIVAPWDKDKSGTMVVAYKEASKTSTTLAKIEAGVLVKIHYCEKDWCSIAANDETNKVNGFVSQEHLWGVYPGEDVE